MLNVDENKSVGAQTPPDRQRLGELVARRRLALGISERAAAAAAKMSRNTWAAIEAGSQRLGAHRHINVERVLLWEPGSIDAVLAGGEPTPAPVAPSGNQAKLEAEVERIKALPLSREERLVLLKALIDLYAEAEADRPHRVAG